MKTENLILTLAAIALCLLFWLLMSSCSRNLIMDNKAEVVWTKQHVNNKLGGWYERVPNNIEGSHQRFVIGFAQGEMQKDSTYRMKTTDGWIMSIKYDQLAWTP